MNRRHLTTALCSLALLAPATAVADDAHPIVQSGPYHGYEQHPGLAKCFWSVKKKQKLSAVIKHGVPITGQCDRDTQVSTTMSFVFETKPEMDWADIHSGGIAGIALSERPMVRAGVPFTFHSKFRAGTFSSRYSKVQIDMRFYRRWFEKPNRFPALDAGQHFTIVNDVKKR